MALELLELLHQLLPHRLELRLARPSLLAAALARVAAAATAAVRAPDLLRLLGEPAAQLHAVPRRQVERVEHAVERRAPPRPRVELEVAVREAQRAAQREQLLRVVEAHPAQRMQVSLGQPRLLHARRQFVRPLLLRRCPRRRRPPPGRRFALAALQLPHRPRVLGEDLARYPRRVRHPTLVEGGQSRLLFSVPRRPVAVLDLLHDNIRPVPAHCACRSVPIRVELAQRLMPRIVPRVDLPELSLLSAHLRLATLGSVHQHTQRVRLSGGSRGGSGCARLLFIVASVQDLRRRCGWASAVRWLRLPRHRRRLPRRYRLHRRSQLLVQLLQLVVTADTGANRRRKVHVGGHRLHVLVDELKQKLTSAVISDGLVR